MSARSVHEAAKRTAAEVLCWGHYRDDWTGRTRALCDEHIAEAERVIAALVASAEVREVALDEVASAVDWRAHDHTPRPCCVVAVFDAILAALAREFGVGE